MAVPEPVIIDPRLPPLWRDVYRKAGNVARGIATTLVRQHHTEQHARPLSIFINIDGGGAVITAGRKCTVQLPWGFEIVGWTLFTGAVSGSIVLSIFTSPYDTFPTGLTSITGGGAKPTLSSAFKNTSTTMAGWTTTVPKEHALLVSVASAATVTLVTLTLLVRPI